MMEKGGPVINFIAQIKRNIILIKHINVKLR